jgi:CRP/FNR family cyclic AMP-dependent transcriptional regulator
MLPGCGALSRQSFRERDGNMATDTVLFEKFGRRFAPGAVIFREGDEGSTMYIIQSGMVRITKKIGGKDHVLAVMEKGNFFGEMAMINRKRRTATVSAMTDVELLEFDRDGFYGMIQKNVKIAYTVIDKLCHRLHIADLQIKHLAPRNERELVALNLLYTFKEFETEKRPLHEEEAVEIVSMNLDLPLEQVREKLASFISRGLLSKNGDLLILADASGLEAQAD